jgi:TetR/AcrR family transcriptional regulator of autoinduction and epiphytic fitness
MVEPPRMSDERRAALLAAAAEVFARYGYRKASMDDVARAAGLSRQGLYLHYPTKEQLFREGMRALIDNLLAGASAALDDLQQSPQERLVAAFDAMHGALIDGMDRARMAELIEASTRLVGDLVQEQERTFHARLVAAIERDGVVGVGTPDEIAETLDAVSHGIKRRVASRAEYLARMRTALRLLYRP